MRVILEKHLFNSMGVKVLSLEENEGMIVKGHKMRWTA